MKTIKIKCARPFGAVVAPDATKYLSCALNGANKVLIVADETVFKMYGNLIKKAVNGVGAQAYTFIYPTGENGRTKHVLDKLLILMTELGVTKDDYLIAFGGRSSASIAGLAGKIFKGGVPYVFVPTTLMAMINPVSDGKVGVDFLGQKQLLCTVNYPTACFVETNFLKTLPEQYMCDGYAEVIRRAMIGDGELIVKLQEGTASFEEIVASSILTGERAKSFFKSKAIKYDFALKFSLVAEKLCAQGLSTAKLIGFGIITAIDTAMALGVSYGLEEPMLNLLAKYGVKWDIGLSINKMWQKLGEDGDKNIVLPLPKKPGKIKLVKLSKEKIKDTF